VMGVPGTCGEEPPAGHRDRIGGGRRIEVREREPQGAQPPPHRAKRSQRRDPQQEREGPSHIGASNKRESTRSMGGKDARKVTARRQKAAAGPMWQPYTRPSRRGNRLLVGKTFRKDLRYSARATWPPCIMKQRICFPSSVPGSLAQFCFATEYFVLAHNACRHPARLAVLRPVGINLAAFLLQVAPSGAGPKSA
jgi:hypothetical protein